MTFDQPSATAIMLPPPTASQQVQQPADKGWCADSVGLTLYRMITGKNESLEQVVKEMQTDDNNGTQISNFLNWLNDHEVESASTEVRTTWAIGMITDEIKSGNYVVPYVNENGKPHSPHVLIVYAVDPVQNKIFLSDSNRHLGMNRFALDTSVFENQWLINVGSNNEPQAILMFMNKNPRPVRSQASKAKTAGQAESLHGDLLIK
ncbi:MAG: hypothetical protein HY226_06055 [Candidatus Vogelbacteria bacterium]|nr:hypothetical protein [Candidatus Vogelbacteria bacterium]